MTRVLVAGGTGFLGRAFVRGLHRRGARVAVLTRNPGRASRLELPVEFVEADVRRPGTLAPALRAVDTAILSVQFPGYPVEAPARGRTFIEVDARGTAALVEAAVRGGCAQAGLRIRRRSRSPAPRGPGIARRGWRRRPCGTRAWTTSSSGPHGSTDPRTEASIASSRSCARFPSFFRNWGMARGGSRRFTWMTWRISYAKRRWARRATDSPWSAGGPDIMSLDDVVRTAMTVLGRRRAILHIPAGFAKLAAVVAELVPGQILSRDAVDFVTQDGIADSDLARSRFPTLSSARFRGGTGGVRLPYLKREPSRVREPERDPAR